MNFIPTLSGGAGGSSHCNTEHGRTATHADTKPVREVQDSRGVPGGPPPAIQNTAEPQPTRTPNPSEKSRTLGGCRGVVPLHNYTVGLPGFEPGTSALSGQRSNRAELQARVGNGTIATAKGDPPDGWFEVVGSRYHDRLLRGCSSVGRAPGLQPGGQGFKSPQLHSPQHQPCWGNPRSTPRWIGSGQRVITVLGRV